MVENCRVISAVVVANVPENIILPYWSQDAITLTNIIKYPSRRFRQIFQDFKIFFTNSVEFSIKNNFKIIKVIIQ